MVAVESEVDWLVVVGRVYLDERCAIKVSSVRLLSHPRLAIFSIALRAVQQLERPLPLQAVCLVHSARLRLCKLVFYGELYRMLHNLLEPG